MCLAVSLHKKALLRIYLHRVLTNVYFLKPLFAGEGMIRNAKTFPWSVSD